MGGIISEEDIERVKSTVDIVEVIRRFVPLKKAGKNFVGICPFHPDSDPSFSVSPQKQMFICFGCRKAGSVFTFLMEYSKVDFPTAVRSLAEEVGIDRRRLARVRKHPIVPVCSLDREISDSDDRRYVDLLADEECKSPFESTMLNAWTQEMNDVLGVLTPMEQKIIRWRYGLDSGEEMTLKEIGDYYNLSRERIRQLQEQALRKIRRHLTLDAA